MAAILRINKPNLRLKCGECALNLRIRDCFVFVLALDDRHTKITSYPSLIRLLSENVYGIILRLKMIVPIWGIWGLIPAIEQTWDVAHLSARNFGEGRMATRSWNEDRAKKRIDAQIDALPLKDIEIKDYVRDTDLTNLPGHIAYRVNGAQPRDMTKRPLTGLDLLTLGRSAMPCLNFTVSPARP
jgi:hypothetical protein